MSRTEAGQLAGGGKPRKKDSRKLQASVLHTVPHILHLRRPRLSRGRAVHLPHLRTQDRGIQPYNRLLPSCSELERRQDSRVQGAQGLRHRNLAVPRQGDKRIRLHGHRAYGSRDAKKRECNLNKQKRHTHLYNQDLPQLQNGKEYA